MRRPSAPSSRAPRAPRALSAAARAALARLQRLLAGWDGVELTTSFGHPTFRVAGAAFAVLDRYQESDCLWLKVPPAERDALLATPGWFAAPYDPRRTALCVRLEAIDWRRIRPRVRISYALAAGSGRRSRAR
jgi:predicted DNA-binding protein (MmcQ/YjbR family)